MAITTQYGSEVQIIELRAYGWVLVRRLSDGAEREWHVSQLRADTAQDLETLRIATYGDVRA